LAAWQPQQQDPGADPHCLPELSVRLTLRWSAWETWYVACASFEGDYR
jgi:hypothetical protein